jgi:hypothetical protein
MGELIEVTGDTQYNIFKRLEARGHSVRRDGAGRGMRIWLKHQEAKSISTNGSDPIVKDDLHEDDADSICPELERWTLSLERDLQRALRGSLDLLEPGLVAVDGGREEAFRDMTAKDKSGNIVVIELKASKAGPEAVTQLLAYMGEVKETMNPSGLRGILIAPDFQAKAIAAASIVPNMTLRRYQFHLTFENA